MLTSIQTLFICLDKVTTKVTSLGDSPAYLFIYLFIYYLKKSVIIASAAVSFLLFYVSMLLCSVSLVFPHQTVAAMK